MLFNKDFEIVLICLPYRTQSAFIYNALVKLDCQDRFRDRKGERAERRKGHGIELDSISRGKKKDSHNFTFGTFTLQIS